MGVLCKIVPSKPSETFIPWIPEVISTILSEWESEWERASARGRAERERERKRGKESEREWEKARESERKRQRVRERERKREKEEGGGFTCVFENCPLKKKILKGRLTSHNSMILNLGVYCSRDKMWMLARLLVYQRCNRLSPFNKMRQEGCHHAIPHEGAIHVQHACRAAYNHSLSEKSTANFERC